MNYYNNENSISKFTATIDGSLNCGNIHCNSIKSKNNLFLLNTSGSLITTGHVSCGNLYCSTINGLSVLPNENTGPTGASGPTGATGWTGMTGLNGPSGLSYFTKTGNDIYYSSGNVGINTYATLNIFEVNGNSIFRSYGQNNFSLICCNGNPSATTNCVKIMPNTNGSYNPLSINNDNMILFNSTAVNQGVGGLGFCSWVANAYGVIIDNNGNVGINKIIGITNYALDISGSIGVSNTINMTYTAYPTFNNSNQIGYTIYGNNTGSANIVNNTNTLYYNISVNPGVWYIFVKYYFETFSATYRGINLFFTNTSSTAQYYSDTTITNSTNYFVHTLYTTSTHAVTTNIDAQFGINLLSGNIKYQRSGGLLSATRIA